MVLVMVLVTTRGMLMLRLMLKLAMDMELLLLWLLLTLLLQGVSLLQSVTLSLRRGATRSQSPPPGRLPELCVTLWWMSPLSRIVMRQYPGPVNRPAPPTLVTLLLLDMIPRL